MIDDEDKPIPFDGEQSIIEALDPEIWVQMPLIPKGIAYSAQFEALLINRSI